MLDEVMIGSSLGADPMPKGVAQTKLKFGIFDKDRGEVNGAVDGETKHERAGFGLENQVRPLKKMQSCC